MNFDQILALFPEGVTMLERVVNGKTVYYELNAERTEVTVWGDL